MFENSLPSFSHLNEICDHDHKYIWNYLWMDEHVDSYHNSQHLFDPYSFVHIMSTGIYYLLFSLIFGHNEFTVLLVIMVSLLYELKENSIKHIVKYGVASGSYGLDNEYVPLDTLDGKNTPYVYRKNGKEYRFMREGYNLFMVDKNDKKIKRIKLEELQDYGLKIYRGDSIVNIIGDIISNIAGIFIVVYFLGTAEPTINLIIYFTMLLLFIIAINPGIIEETKRYAYLLPLDLSKIE